MSDELEKLRKEILTIDEELVRLVRRRVETATRIGRIKDEHDMPLQNFAVEKNVLDHALAVAAAEGVEEDATRKIVESLVRAALHAQEKARIRGKPAKGKSALVVGGAGLMGGWFARFLEEKGFAVKVQDPRTSRWPAGRADDGPYDLVVLATPPSTLPALLDEIVPALSGSTLVFDIASIKGPAQATLRRLARKGHRVASMHPMFGPKAELLMGKNVLVLDCGNPEAVKAAAGLFGDTTAAIHHMPLEEHDAKMAAVLGLAHATSLVFNRTLTDGPYSWEDLAPFASTTFRKQVEVSREVARENPRLYFEIQTLNPENEAMLERLARATDAIRMIVADQDEEAFEEMMLAAREFYDGGPSS